MTLIGPDVIDLGRRAADAWRRHQPTRARLWCDGIGPDEVESFDPAGRDRWRAVVRGLEGERRRLAARETGPADRAALDHLARFLREEADRTSRDRLAGLLDLVATLLLPMAATRELVAPRIGAATGWLTAFADRAVAGGDVLVTAADRTGAFAMADGLAELGLAPDHALVSALARVASLDVSDRGGDRGGGLSIAEALERLECTASEDLLATRLEQVIAEDIESLNEVPALPDDAGELPNPAARLELEVASIRRLAARLGFAPRSRGATVRVAPRALDRIVSDAFFLSGAALGPGRLDLLFLHRSHLAPPVGRARLGGLKRVLAHELCPGHAEHWEASRGAAWSELTLLRRSPAGLEGWALEAERRIALAAGDPRLLESCLLHRLRRFIACRVLVARGRRDDGASSPDQLFGRIRDPARARILETWTGRTLPGGARNLVYAAGWLETVAALDSLGGGRRGGDGAVFPAYLAVGPFAPATVMALHR